MEQIAASLLSGGTATDTDHISEALTAVFGTDPLNWAKWAVVFAVLILTYIFLIRSGLYRWVTYRLSHQYKVDQAVRAGHVVLGEPVKFHVSRARDPRAPKAERNSGIYWINVCHVVYSYTVDGITRQYRTYHNDRTVPFQPIELYYLHSPEHVFDNDINGKHRNAGPVKTLLRFILLLLPFLLAALVMSLLGVDTGGL